MLPVPLQVRTRLLKGVFANLVGKIWILLAQFALVPVLTHAWGAKTYGVWLMLSTIPTYVALSDLGFGSSAAVAMTREYARGNESEALAAFQSVWALIASVGVLLFVLTSLGLLGVSIFFPAYLNAQAYPHLGWAALLLVIYSALAMQMGVISAGYRAVGRYAAGTFFYDLAGPVEIAATLAAVWAGGDILAVAAVMVVVRLTALLVYYARLRHTEPWIRLGFSHASVSMVKVLAAPSFATVGITFGGALSLQGVLLAVGFVLGPAAAGAYGAARTLSRIPLQLVSLGMRASVPELTASYARGDKHLFKKLININVAICLAVALPSMVGLALLGPFVLHRLSGGHLSASTWVFLALGVAMAAQAMWNTLALALSSINLQGLFVNYYIPICGLTLVGACLMPKWAGNLGVASIAAICEVAVLAVVVRALLSVVRKFHVGAQS
jgi:O-antigen/teichoic acid export membrane protein